MIPKLTAFPFQEYKQEPSFHLDVQKTSEELEVEKNEVSRERESFPIKNLQQLTQALDQENTLEFKRIFQKLKNDKKDQKARALVEKILHDHILRLKESLDPNGRQQEIAKHAFILSILKDVYPAIEDYLIEFGRLGYILTPKAIQMLVDYLKKKGTFQDMDCQFCSDSEAFETQLIEQWQQMKQAVGMKKRCSFLVCIFPETDHITHIYLEKSAEDQYRIFISDTLGGPSVFASLIQVELYRILRENSSLQRPIIYNYAGNPRQRDQTTCSIFALRDAIQFAKHAEEIMNWVESRIPAAFNDPKSIRQMNILPPQLMKATQSLSSIEQYNRRYEEKVNLKAKHLSTNKKGRQNNNKISNRYLKYERIILANIIYPEPG